MTAAQRRANIARDWRFLGDADRAAFAPSPSERAVQTIARRMVGSLRMERSDLYCAAGVFAVALIFTLQIVHGWAA